MTQKTKVAILGGGMGALSAAWQLVKQDPDRFEITVYQRGSRLGGKGASGRNMQAGKGKRIEEHGLHILMGFYDNAFHVLKDCYDALGGQGISTWKEAVTGENFIHIPDQYEDGHWAFWELKFPDNASQLPGERAPEELPDTKELFFQALSLLFDLKRDSDDLRDDDKDDAKDEPAPDHNRLRVWRTMLLTADAKVAELALITVIKVAANRIFARAKHPERTDNKSVRRRRQAMAAYFVAANLIGVIQYGLWKREDYLNAARQLDDVDYKQWLERQYSPKDAPAKLTWDSPLVNALYDLIFSRFPDQKPQPGFAAGTALYDGLLVLLYYWGHVFYRMNGGMGDVVFAPLYLHLKNKGVQFKFFHTVKELGVANGAVDRIVVESEWDGAYEPLFECQGRLCWRQPEAGDPPPGQQAKRELTLTKGSHFDYAVLGISVGALKDRRLAGALCNANAKFAEMVAKIRTVPTQAMQLWFDREPAALGWPLNPAMMGSFARPFQAWANMYQTLPREEWEADGVEVKSIAYLCDVYVDPPQGAEQQVRAEALAWLKGPARALWPDFSFDRLAGSNASGEARLDDQYLRVNLDASDGYVLAATGTSKFRLAPDESGFSNLLLAGDWTRTDLNAGCL